MPGHAAIPVALAEDPAVCTSNQPLVIPRPELFTPGQDIHISAGRSTTEQGNLYILEDNVKLDQGTRALYADRMTYDKQTDHADAEGHVRYEQQGVVLQGNHATISLTTNVAQIDDAQYVLGDQKMRGTAEHIDLSNGNVILTGATYTTCRPGQDHWLLSASNLEVNNDTNTGTARNVVLEFFSIPLFYFPYLNFSLGPRKSGILPPLISNSNNTGVDLALPYYWNIAPDRDATLTPRYMSARGVQLNSEFRYLNRTNKGTLYAEWMPNDTLMQASRSLISWDHKQQFSSHSDGGFTYAKVGDGKYFRELGSNLNIASLSYLERNARLRYGSDQYALSALAQNFQVLDPNLPIPYQRLPQITGTWRGTWARSQLETQADYVHFFRAATDRVQRLHLAPRLAMNWRNESGYFVPSVTLRATQYRIYSGQNLTRVIPTASLGSGLFFDRDDVTRRHTLEPQVFYTFTPYQDQTSLPSPFESGVPEVSLAQLLREDRYTGIDRIGDQQRLVSALTYRNFLRERGVEELVASGALIYHLSTERVTLPGQSATPAGAYDTFAALDTHWGPRWSTHGDIYWPMHEQNPAKGAALLKYTGNTQRGELAYRYRRDQWELIQASVGWRPQARWRVAARANYSLDTRRLEETVAGVEFSDCCWGVSFILRRFVTDIHGAENTAIGLQFELKGLSSVGSRLDQGLAHDLFTF
ncbi:MAG: LPS assembly protein LptD [Gammaproteobacteria bacterium]|nr:LPS assembly protein LptD [Gammaproteobacteria bacterium]